MKMQISFGLVGVLALATFLAKSQLASDSVADSKAAPGPLPLSWTESGSFLIGPEEGGVSRYGIDLTTYEFVDLLTGSRGELNSPEEIETRARSFLRLFEPDEFEKRFPKSAEEIAFEAATMIEILVPLTPKQREALMTPEELETERNVIADMLAVKPVADINYAPNAPGYITISPKQP